VVLDRSVRRSAGGRRLLGGHPTRSVLLSDAGAGVLDAWVAGAPVGDRPAEGRLARRLLDAGLAHPVPPSAGGQTTPEVAVVVAVRDATHELARLLEALGPGGQVVVVDDASRDVAGVARVAGDAGARLVRLPVNRGPGGARNVGAASVAAGIVAFVDADCVVPAGWLAALVGHFADPAVGAVGPRLVGAGLDADGWPSAVGPGRPVPYLPGGAVVVRREALGPGFDENLHVGEDVDLSWRLCSQGWRLRYEPAAVVEHRPRRRRLAVVARSYAYGRGEAALARRHPGAVGALRTSPWPTAIWVLLVAGQPRVATAAGCISVSLLAWRLRDLDDRYVGRAVALTASGLATAGATHGRSVPGSCGPLSAVVSLVGPRTGARLGVLWLASAVAAGLPAGVTVTDSRAPAQLLRAVAGRAGADLGLGAGRWVGVLRGRSADPIRPRWLRAVESPGC
jgi:mycofactocin system glycosyltransferase